jgi:predicted nucleic acid-binding protein
LAVLIDTSVAVRLRDGDPEVMALLDQVRGRAMLSIVSRVELEGGVYREPAKAELMRKRLDLMLVGLEQLDFGEAEAEAYGRIVAALGFSRRQVADRMIAATAIVAGAVLVTSNARDFRDVPDLRVEDLPV